MAVLADKEAFGGMKMEILKGEDDGGERHRESRPGVGGRR
jgi:hypothetical protein